ncbi:MAG: hypothetical protein VX466_05935 [Myxococcota bacterium]|nr:hypothetical protein [Myxococcota bacterium]
MRSSYRFSLIAGSLLAAAVLLPSLDVFFDPAAGALLDEQTVSRDDGERAGGHVRPPSTRLGSSTKPPIPRGSTNFVHQSDPLRAASAAAAGPEFEVEKSLYWLGVFETPEQPLVSVAGLDFAAPRDLTLWKVDEVKGHATPVTRIRSRVGRPFLAEHLLLSARGARLVVSPRGFDPFGPLASKALDVPPLNVVNMELP